MPTQASCAPFLHGWSVQLTGSINDQKYLQPNSMCRDGIRKTPLKQHVCHYLLTYEAREILTLVIQESPNTWISPDEAFDAKKNWMSTVGENSTEGRTTPGQMLPPEKWDYFLLLFLMQMPQLSKISVIKDRDSRGPLSSHLPIPTNCVPLLHWSHMEMQIIRGHFLRSRKGSCFASKSE